MDNETRREVTQWLLKGQRDLDVADLLSKNKPSYLDVAAYHCQPIIRYPGPTGEPLREEITGIIAQVDAFVRFVRELLINT